MIEHQPSRTKHLPLDAGHQHGGAWCQRRAAPATQHVTPKQHRRPSRSRSMRTRPNRRMTGHRAPRSRTGRAVRIRTGVLPLPRPLLQLLQLLLLLLWAPLLSAWPGWTNSLPTFHSQAEIDAHPGARATRCCCTLMIRASGSLLASLLLSPPPSISCSVSALFFALLPPLAAQLLLAPARWIQIHHLYTHALPWQAGETTCTPSTAPTPPSHSRRAHQPLLSTSPRVGGLASRTI